MSVVTFTFGDSPQTPLASANFSALCLAGPVSETSSGSSYESAMAPASAPASAEFWAARRAATLTP